MSKVTMLVAQIKFSIKIPDHDSIADLISTISRLRGRKTEKMKQINSRHLSKRVLLNSCDN